MSNMYFVLSLDMLLIDNTCLHYRRIEVQRERQLRDAEGEAEKKLIKQSEETDTAIQTVDNKLAELRQQYQQVEADLKTAGDEARQTDSAFKVFLQPYCIQCCFYRL
jgi:outer membrane murein-binding lipoprotein Lpp